MRLLVAALLLPLSFSMAYADPPVAVATPAVSPAPKLVGVILSTSQALLWDGARGEYVIKRVGETVDGAQIVALGRDRLVLDRNGARETLALSAAPTTHAEAPRRMPAVIVGAPNAPAPQVVASAAPPASSPVAPTAAIAPAVAPPAIAATAAVPTATVVAPAIAPAAPAPPLASPAQAADAPTVVATPAPPAPPAAPIASPDVATSAPVAAAPAPAAAPPAPVAAPSAPVAAAPASVPAFPAPVAAAPASVPAPPAPVAAPPAPVAPPPGAIAAPYVPPTMPAFPAAPPTVAQGPILIIPRTVVDRELGDFTTLASEATVSPGARGGFRLANLRAGSFLERIGLRSGDTVLRVDGRPINAVEDASAAYAWLRVTDHFTVDLMRDGRPVQLRYVIAGPQTASN
ncbi:MAG: hypothetical protein ACHQ17_03560 [Polyangia bacterium]